MQSVEKSIKEFEDGQKIAKTNINDFDEVKTIRDGTSVPSDLEMAAHLEHLHNLGGFAQIRRPYYRQINPEYGHESDSDSEPEK